MQIGFLGQAFLRYGTHEGKWDLVNKLRIDEISEIRNRALAGNSLRKISRDLGVSTNTVSKYVNGNFGFCKCGQKATHKGWCKERYKASESRQAFHAKRKGIILPVRPKPIRSRSQEGRVEKSLWLDMPEGKRNPLPKSMHIRAVGDVTYICRNLKIDEADDVRQHMILSIIDGFLDFEDLPRSLTSFISYHRRSLGFSFSINDQGQNGMSYEGMFSEEDVRSRWEDLYIGIGVRIERKTKYKTQLTDKERKDANC